MVDGPTEATDFDRTESNRQTVRSFVEDILIDRRLEKLEHYADSECYTEHSPRLADDLSELRSALQPTSSEGVDIQYDRIHRVLTEGNFALSVSEGRLNGVHTAFYDLFRVAEGKLVEHWDTIEAVPPRTEWKNNNGKF